VRAGHQFRLAFTKPKKGFTLCFLGDKPPAAMNQMNVSAGDAALHLLAGPLYVSTPVDHLRRFSAGIPVGLQRLCCNTGTAGVTSRGSE
jgi:hypothetical protein